jgi:hypothetical protein
METEPSLHNQWMLALHSYSNGLAPSSWHQQVLYCCVAASLVRHTEVHKYNGNSIRLTAALIALLKKNYSNGQPVHA